MSPITSGTPLALQDDPCDNRELPLPALGTFNGLGVSFDPRWRRFGGSGSGVCWGRIQAQQKEISYVNGSSRATGRGVCPVSAPPDKKLALATLTLNLCALPYTTVSLHRCIVGAWVSVLLFTRPMMSLLNEAFHLASAYEGVRGVLFDPFASEGRR